MSELLLSASQLELLEALVAEHGNWLDVMLSVQKQQDGWALAIVDVETREITGFAPAKLYDIQVLAGRGLIQFELYGSDRGAIGVLPAAYACLEDARRNRGNHADHRDSKQPPKSDLLDEGVWLMPPVPLSALARRLGPGIGSAKAKTLLEPYGLQNWPPSNRQSYTVRLDTMPPSLRDKVKGERRIAQN